MVKVIAAISSGCATRESRTRYRWIRSSVFPEPAGACTMKERWGSSASLRPSKSATGSASFIRGFRRTQGDRKSTRLNSSHSQISYAVFCLKKKKNTVASQKHLQATECAAHPRRRQSLGKHLSCRPSRRRHAAHPPKSLLHLALDGTAGLYL